MSESNAPVGPAATGLVLALSAGAFVVTAEVQAALLSLALLVVLTLGYYAIMAGVY